MPRRLVSESELMEDAPEMSPGGVPVLVDYDLMHQIPRDLVGRVKRARSLRRACRAGFARPT